MITLSDLEKYDPSDMHKVYDRWPELARDAYESDLEPINFDDIDHIIFSGMGGSGAIGDMFFSALSKTSIHVNVIKGYLLPNTVNSNTLVIATSASGNTVETITTVQSATKMNCRVVCFSSGGKLEEICKKNNVPFRKIPLYNNPRASFPAYVYSILKVLNSVIPTDKECIKESISQMQALSEKISTKNLSDSNPSLSLAEWLDDISMIYYPWGLQAAAIRFKNSIQENMKRHAMIEDVIETCHNGIVSWETRSNVKPVLIRGTEDYTKTKERWDILKQYFKENNIEFQEITSVDGNVFSKIINLIYLLDFSTIYRAIIDKIDPAPVKSIDYIKKRL